MKASPTTTHSTPALWSNPWMAKTLHPDESLTFIFQYYAMLNSFEFLDFPISRPFLVSLCEILSFWQLVTFYNFLQLAANPQRVRADLHKLPLRPVFKHEAAQLKVMPSKSDFNHFQEKNEKGLFNVYLLLWNFLTLNFLKELVSLWRNSI